jgi:hypothetical protein
MVLAKFWAIFIQTHLVTLLLQLPSSSIEMQQDSRTIADPYRPLLMNRVARFFLVHDTKAGKMYQMNTKCTK